MLFKLSLVNDYFYKKTKKLKKSNKERTLKLMALCIDEVQLSTGHRPTFQVLI